MHEGIKAVLSVKHHGARLQRIIDLGFSHEEVASMVNSQILRFKNFGRTSLAVLRKHVPEPEHPMPEADFSSRWSRGR